MTRSVTAEHSLPMDITDSFPFSKIFQARIPLAYTELFDSFFLTLSTKILFIACSNVQNPNPLVAEVYVSTSSRIDDPIQYRNVSLEWKFLTRRIVHDGTAHPFGTLAWYPITADVNRVPIIIWLWRYPF